MKVTFTCKSEEDADKIYDLLTNPSSGCNVLSGSKVCTNYYSDLPDVWEFNLTQKEFEKVLELPGVVYGTPNLGKPKTMSYIKVGQKGIPRLASYRTTFSNNNSVTECIPHSLLYCQDYDVKFTHQSPTDGSEIVSLSSIDCSNVDIIILDSGVDITHRDLFDSNGVSRVINFNWTLLRGPNDVINGPQIINTLPADWVLDKDGHGTACASLAAGNRCGFAKNARIYFIKANGLDPNNQGIDIEIALQLVLSFQKSKKLNLHGLDSSRPTIFSNSWGYVGPRALYGIDNSIDNRNFSTVFYLGKRPFNLATGDGLPFTYSPVDSYFRQILDEGVHTLKSAGNGATYLKNDPAITLNTHWFTRNGSWYIIPRTQSNINSYQLNVSYSGFVYGYSGFTAVPYTISYGSPDIGLNTQAPLNFAKTQYPLITVGDIIPVGFNDTDADTYWSAGNAKAAYAALSGNATPSLINGAPYTRYTTLSGPFFVKSAYSNFGPDVEIYAPGNGAWAALSNNKTIVNAPNFTVSGLEKYQFFNGTSSSCPIVAGILATYLAEFPNATNKEARTWLLQSAVSGNIMETIANTLPVNSTGTTTLGTTNVVLNLPFGSNYDNMNEYSYLRLQKADTNYNKANIFDVAFSNRFFDSRNLIAQAYPLRKAIVRTTTEILNFTNTSLISLGGTTQKITHTLPSVPLNQSYEYELVEPNFNLPEIGEGVRLV